MAQRGIKFGGGVKPTWLDKSEGYTLEIPFFMSKIVSAIIEAPQKGIETNNFKAGLEAVTLGAFQLERLADAHGDIDLNSENYRQFVQDTKKQISEMGHDEETDVARTMLGYAKIAHILKQINDKKTKTGHMTI